MSARVPPACKMLYLWQRLGERLTTSEGSECWWFSRAGGTSECGGVGGLDKELLSSLLELQTNIGGSAVQQGLAGCARGSSSGWLEEWFFLVR